MGLSASHPFISFPAFRLHSLPREFLCFSPSLIFGREEEFWKQDFRPPVPGFAGGGKRKKKNMGDKKKGNKGFDFTFLHGIEFIPFHSIHGNDNPIFRVCVCVLLC